MTIYTIEPAVPGDAQYVAGNVRKAERLEADAVYAGRLSARQATLIAAAASRNTAVGKADRVPICVFGVVPPPSLGRQVWVPWFVATGELSQHALPFLRRCRPVIEAWRQEYPVMENFVDARNRTSVQWLRWLGFEIGEPKPYGERQLPFHKFSMGGER